MAQASKDKNICGDFSFSVFHSVIFADKFPTAKEFQSHAAYVNLHIKCFQYVTPHCSFVFVTRAPVAPEDVVSALVQRR